MLKISNKDFNEAILKIIQHVITNSLKTNE